MSEETIAVVGAAAAVALFLVYENQQQQQQVTNALLVKIATTPSVVQAPAANPLAALTSIIGPIIGLL